jgi:gas vesicle protein
MRKVTGLAVGLLLGAAVGAALVYLFAPTSGEQLVNNIKRGFDETMTEARQASIQRRQELQAELTRMKMQ